MRKSRHRNQEPNYRWGWNVWISWSDLHWGVETSLRSLAPKGCPVQGSGGDLWQDLIEATSLAEHSFTFVSSGWFSARSRNDGQLPLFRRFWYPPGSLASTWPSIKERVFQPSFCIGLCWTLGVCVCGFCKTRVGVFWWFMADELNTAFDDAWGIAA